MVPNEQHQAPCITEEHLREVVASEHYFTAEEGVLGAYKANNDVYVGSVPGPVSGPSLKLLTICVLVLKNGYTIVGKSACASPENFDAAFGRGVARSDAMRQIWALEGYLLRTVLALRAEFARGDDRGPVGALLGKFGE